MEQPFSPNDYEDSYISIKAEAQPSVEPRHHDESIMFKIKVHVMLTYYSAHETCTRKVNEINNRLLRSFEFPYHLIASYDDDGTTTTSSASRDIVSGVISDMDIPFPLERLKWGEARTPLETKDDLIRHILDFAHNLRDFPCNVNSKKFSMYLIIDKRVVIPHHEFEAKEAMKRAMSEERRVQALSTFVSRGIKRGRGSLESLERTIEHAARVSVYDRASYNTDYELTLVHSLIEQARREFTDGLLEKVVLDGPDMPEMCSICLEKFSIGCEACRLPCLHTYHGECIGKWLIKSRFCPYCRFSV